MSGAHIEAPAKLTLSLRVTGVRADGYHFIDAEMVSLDLADALTFAPGTGLAVSGPFAAEVPVDGSNLVAKALAAVGRQAHVHIDKRIPVRGGLGGGSADAAAVLRWAGVDDIETATKLGADVPFCLAGGRARVGGIGELLTPLEAVSSTFTLLIPPFGISTAAAFAAWDRLGGPTSGGPNDLEVAAQAVEPRLRLWHERFANATGHTPILAGSGSTMFVHGDHADEASTVAGATVLLVRTRQA